MNRTFNGGAKAAMLQRLQQAGFSVPPFVVSPVDAQDALDQIGVPVAVRSSADVEDGGATSFAGQFRSVLNLSTPTAVENAIRECHESVHSPHVFSYCRRNGVDPADVRISAIVQRMVRPELAGVAFTLNPITGDDEVVIEAHPGLADDLLSGHIASLPRGDPLLERHRRDIENVARGIQHFLGTPQDVEFAIEGGKVFVLQSRPITRIGFAAEPGEWTNADFRDGGVSSGVCSPLMWSLYELVWNSALKASLRELRLFRQDFVAGKVFFGRPYWNVGEVKECIAKLPGFVERDFDEDLNIAIAYEGQGRVTPVTLSSVCRTWRTILALPGFFRRQQRVDRKLLSTEFDSLSQRYDGWRGDPVSALNTLIQCEFFATECNYFRTIFAMSLAKMDFTSSFPGANYPDLVSGLPPLRHLYPMRAVEKLAVRDDVSLDRVIDVCRHHYRHGLDMRFPRWDEERESVRQMLRGLPTGPPGRADDIRRRHDAALEESLSCLPRWKWNTFQRKLDRLRTFVWLREEMRDLSNQLYYLLRQFALEIGRRRGIGDDLFFMTFGEILADDRSNLSRNRDVYERYRHFKAPNEIGSRYGMESGVAKSRSNVLHGIAASPGVAMGRARVAMTVREALEMNSGEILVCPFTDPGWTPVLDLASGVVTETGGMLSHAAVICREYGIPAVLGVADATSCIRTGMKIVVRGGEGCVECTTARN